MAWSLLAGVIVLATASILMGAQTMLYRRVPLDTPPEALAQRARDVLRSVGYTEPPMDTAIAFYEDSDFLRYVAEHDQSKTRWDNLETGPLGFWYRGSPRPLASGLSVARPPFGLVSTDAPPLDVSGMTLVRLNPVGRLTQLIAIPPQVEKMEATASPPDWPALFSAAGLDPSRWQPAQPAWTPPVYSDARAAWAGSLSERPNLPMRIEAAAYRGKPVYFELIGPWTRPERMQQVQQTAGERAFSVMGVVLALSLTVIGAMLAWRNLRMGRGDRRGAFRLAAFVFAAGAVAWFFGTHHVSDFSELSLLFGALSLVLAFSFLFWVLYIALEPYVRRRWPATLVSWSRLLEGGFRDPLVGRDVLAGCLWAAFANVLLRLGWYVPSWLGYPPTQPLSGPTLQFLGVRAILSSISNSLQGSLLLAFFFLFLLFLFRSLLGNEWVAAVAWVLFLTVFIAADKQPFSVFLVENLILNGVTVFLLRRLGFLALTATFVFQTLLTYFPLTTQASAWYSGISLAAILMMAAMVFYGFYTSLGGRPIFRGGVLED